MTTTVASIVAKAATLLNDTALDRWSQDFHVDSLNEGSLALVKFKPDAKIKTANATLVAGAKQTTPSDCISVIELRRVDGGNAITKCDRASLDRFDPSWMVTPQSYDVVHWMEDPQPNTFYVYPAQGVSPATVSLTYGALPTTVAYGGNLDVRDIYADNIVYYMLYRAYVLDTEAGAAEKAAAFYKLFTG